MIRNEQTLLASTYAERLPEDLAGRQCYVLDPMLATGGTLAGRHRLPGGSRRDHITAVTLLAAPEGIARLEADTATSASDDAGDRGDGREAQREGLHRAGSRRRR
jgi:uracil phosphoribosyltransferase